MAAWMIAGTYATRAPATHLYNLGLSYSAQRYDVGNPLVLNAASSNRSASEVFAFDTWTTFTVTALAVTSAHASRNYDCLDSPVLISPRLAVAVTSSRSPSRQRAPRQARAGVGAEEFLPPSDAGVWLPPQRLFSTLDPDGQLRAERTTHAALQVERDVAGLTFAVRAFRQHADDQLVTLFGASVP